MRLLVFMVKVLWVTLCMAWLLHNFCPRYQAVAVDSPVRRLDIIDGNWTWN